MYDCFPQGWIYIYLYIYMYVSHLHVHEHQSVIYIMNGVTDQKRVKLWITLYMYHYKAHIQYMYSCTCVWKLFSDVIGICLNYYTVKVHMHTDRTNHLHVIFCTCTCIHCICTYCTCTVYCILCKFTCTIYVYNNILHV